MGVDLGAIPFDVGLREGWARSAQSIAFALISFAVGAMKIESELVVYAQACPMIFAIAAASSLKHLF
jgi:hypothetical protein